MLVYFTSFTTVSEDIRKNALKKEKKPLKKALKMSSQLVIFRVIFWYFRPPDPESEKKARKSTNEKF